MSDLLLRSLILEDMWLRGISCFAYNYVSSPELINDVIRGVCDKHFFVIAWHTSLKRLEMTRRKNYDYFSLMRPYSSFFLLKLFMLGEFLGIFFILNNFFRISIVVFILLSRDRAIFDSYISHYSLNSLRAYVILRNLVIYEDS